MHERSLPLPFAIDLRRTLANVRRGSPDPTCRIDATGIWRASRTPGGPATVHLVDDGGIVRARAWGDGAGAALDLLPDLIGATDHAPGFAPDHPVVRRLWRDFAGVRIPRTHAVAETLVSVVLEQRVTTFEARRSHAQLVATWGEPAPGPGGLHLPPDPEVLATVPYYELHVLGVERSRADTVRRVAASARQLDALVDLDHATAHQRLRQIVGVGPWSAAETALVALGDADAVPVGDVHLPSTVTHVLTGTAIDDDDAMLEALEPFAGHRGRVIRLIGAAGLHAPRRAPRYAPRDLRRQ